MQGQANRPSRRKQERVQAWRHTADELKYTDGQGHSSENPCTTLPF